MALMPVTEALSAVLAGAEPLPEETVALDAAHHRVLARDVAALRTQPPQAMSAMDGYAVRSADASAVAARLKVIGEVAAGRPFERAVGKGEAIRIFTGGVVPEGADAVIIQEDTVVEDGGITITEAAIAGRHIRPAGVDFRKGDILLARGTRLTDRDLSLAAGGVRQVNSFNGGGTVFRRRVAGCGNRSGRHLCPPAAQSSESGRRAGNSCADRRSALGLCCFPHTRSSLRGSAGVQDRGAPGLAAVVGSPVGT